MTGKSNEETEPRSALRSWATARHSHGTAVGCQTLGSSELWHQLGDLSRKVFDVDLFVRFVCGSFRGVFVKELFLWRSIARLPETLEVGNIRTWWIMF